MKCLIVQPIHEDGIALLRKSGIEPVMCPSADMVTVSRLIGDCDAVITRDAGLSGEAIEAGAILKAIVIHGAGHDAVDKMAALLKGVLVCNTPGANARSVSELALGLAISAARQIPAADQAVRTGRQGFREAERFRELHGKTALVVGWGATAQGLGHMLDVAFAMRVLVYSPHSIGAIPYESVPTLEAGLALADLISVHTPLREETRNMFDDKVFSSTKPGAVFINTARAGLVDEMALARAIENGTIAAAGLDVYSAEAPNGPLALSNRVIFTPHLGGTTGEALKRVAVGAARNVVTALSGERPATTIEIPRGLVA